MIIVIILVGILLWMVGTYILYKIGLKLGVKKSYPWYLIPIYNVWLIAKRNNFEKSFFSLFILIPIINIVVYLTNNILKPVLLGNNEQMIEESMIVYAMIIVSFLLIIVLNIRLWGNVAKTFGKDFWLYGISIALLIFPILKLALNKSKRVFLKYIELKPLNSNFQIIKVEENKSKRLGQGDNNDISINNPYLSMEHINIEYKDNEVFITDLNSSNGTYIEGRKLEPYSSTPLNRGERLILASEDVVYQHGKN